MQSKIGDIYRQVRDALKSSSVLFSGTPCQCAGLKNFLGFEPENLLTVDLICHGTPSPALWEDYIAEMGYAHEISHVNFRSKRNGWVSNMEINFFDQGHYFRAVNQDFYGKLFLDGLTLRPTCHKCKFKFPNGRSDLTIGDAWGVHSFAPTMADTRGTSLVVVNTQKGENFFNQTNLRTQRVKFSSPMLSNRRLISPIVADPRRKKFFEEFAKVSDTFAVMQKYFYQNNPALNKKVAEQNKINFMKRYRAIATLFHQKTKENILVITAPLDARKKFWVNNYFDKNFPDASVYFLQPEGDGELFLMDNFSSVRGKIKEDAENLSKFASNITLTKIFCDKEAKFDTTVVPDWLKTCGVPVKMFSLT